MSFYRDTVTLGLYWFGRGLNLHNCSAEIHNFLKALQQREDVLQQVYIMDRRGYTPFASDRQDLEKGLALSVETDQFFYDGAGQKCDFSPSSFSLDGFGGAFTDSNRNEDRTITIDVTCGQVLSSAWPTYTPNVVLVDVRADIATPALLRRLMLASLEFWRPADAMVRYVKVLDVPDRRPDEILPGYWMYIADPSASDAVSSEFAREYYADGVILKAVEEPDLSANPDHLARVTRLRDELRAAGWLTRRRELSARFPSVTIPIAA